MTEKSRRSPPITGLQLQVLRILLELGKASAGEVQSKLNHRRQLAYSTISTVLQRLEKREAVIKTVDGRTHYYQANISLDRVYRENLERIIHDVFGNSAAELIRQLVTLELMSATKLQETLDQIVSEESDDSRG